MADPRVIDDESRKAGMLDLTAPTTLVDPSTGTLLDLTGPTEELAVSLDSIREMESKLREVKGAVNGELLRRLDRDRNWTQQHGGYTLKAPSDAPVTEWDVDKLVVVLTELVDEGKISREAMDAALKQKVEWRPQHNGLKAIAKNPELAGRIDGCKTEVPNERRYVSVKRAG